MKKPKYRVEQVNWFIVFVIVLFAWMIWFDVEHDNFGHDCHISGKLITCRN